MAKMRLLIAEGNVAADREIFTRFNGCAPSGMFDRMLKSIRSDIATEIFLPTDAGHRPRLSLDAYDGILFTGSNSNIWRREPGTLRQIDFAVSAFSSGTPMFGVCWGLQLATVAAGGDVRPSQVPECRCEAPFSLGITLTSSGLHHPMHAGRTEVYDAFGFHSDQIVALPPGATVTARNRHFIQAVEIRGPKSVFWGVQYHPELSGPDTAGFMRGSVNELIDGGVHHRVEDIEVVSQALERFAPQSRLGPKDQGLLGPVDATKFEFRPLEIMNWLEHMVAPNCRGKLLTAGQPDGAAPATL